MICLKSDLKSYSTQAFKDIKYCRNVQHHTQLRHKNSSKSVCNNIKINNSYCGILYSIFVVVMYDTYRYMYTTTVLKVKLIYSVQ